MSDDSELAWDSVNKDVWLRKTIADIVLVAAGSVQSGDNSTWNIGLEDQLRFSDQFHGRDGGLMGIVMGYASCDGLFYDFDIECDATLKIVPEKASLLRVPISETLYNAVRETLKLSKAESKFDSDEFTVPRIGLKLRQIGGDYLLTVTNPGSLPDGISDLLKQITRAHNANDTEMLTKLMLASVRKGQRVNAEETENHGGMGLLTIKRYFLGMGGDFYLNDYERGTVQAIARFPFKWVHGFDVPPKDQASNVPEGPRDLRTDSARFRSLYYNK